MLGLKDSTDADPKLEFAELLDSEATEKPLHKNGDADIVGDAKAMSGELDATFSKDSDADTDLDKKDRADGVDTLPQTGPKVLEEKEVRVLCGCGGAEAGARGFQISSFRFSTRSAMWLRRMTRAMISSLGIAADMFKAHKF